MEIDTGAHLDAGTLSGSGNRGDSCVPKKPTLTFCLGLLTDECGSPGPGETSLEVCLIVRPSVVMFDLIRGSLVGLLGFPASWSERE